MRNGKNTRYDADFSPLNNLLIHSVTTVRYRSIGSAIIEKFMQRSMQLTDIPDTLKKLPRNIIDNIMRSPQATQIPHFMEFIGLLMRKSIIIPTTLSRIVEAVEISS